MEWQSCSFQLQCIGNCREAQNPYHDSLFCCGWRILWTVNNRCIGFDSSGFDIDLMDTANRMFVLRLAGKTLDDSSNTHANLRNNKNWSLFIQNKSLLMLRMINIHNTILVNSFIRSKNYWNLFSFLTTFEPIEIEKVSCCKFKIYKLSVFVFKPTR